MKQDVFYLSLFTIVLMVLSGACKKDNSDVQQVIPVDTAFSIPAPKAVTKTNSQKVFAHYMPWFETKTTSGNGKWGQHWTMANQNPDQVTGDRQQIASHFYPLIGPYACSDRIVLDYHALLMKYSGIDGAIADWYGTHNVYDHPLIKRNTDSLFNRTLATGLQFAVCYEDATLKNVKTIAGIDTLAAAKADFAYLETRYFGSSGYIRLANKPLLMCFGPQVLKNPGIWQRSLSDLGTKPTLLSLWYQGGPTGSSGSGEYSWVYSDHLAGQQNFYTNRVPGLSSAMAGAYPGFKDFYAQGGWGSTLFTIEHDGISTLQATLSLAKNSNLPVQLITWNDFGEGTMLEPTFEFGYTFLEAIQQFTGVSYTRAELELIYRWYTLRKKYAGNASVTDRLMRAYYYLAALNTAKATEVMLGIE